MIELLFWSDIFGTIVFALSGALMAGRYQLDPFGVIVLAAVTAIGGGTIRDIVLDAPVFWLTNSYYLWVICLTALLTMLFIRRPKRIPTRFLLLADAFGLALFAVVGTEKALSLGAPIPAAVVLGTITGVAGGMIRDVLCNVIPMILRQEIYATAAMLGSSLFALLTWFGHDNAFALLISITCTLALRLAAIYWQVSLPAFHITERKANKETEL